MYAACGIVPQSPWPMLIYTSARVSSTSIESLPIASAIVQFAVMQAYVSPGSFWLEHWHAASGRRHPTNGTASVTHLLYGLLLETLQ